VKNHLRRLQGKIANNLAQTPVVKRLHRQYEDRQFDPDFDEMSQVQQDSCLAIRIVPVHRIAKEEGPRAPAENKDPNGY
jgi:hypothetical protein